VSGKKRSGKDLIGKIIQYLVLYDQLHEQHRDFNKFIQSPLTNEWQSGWQIKKFADKLKNMVCLLIGCTREQLEDDKFKNTELGEEWWYYDRDKFPNLKDNCLKPTPRYLLQYIGTDLFRNQLHPQVWVNTTMVDYKPICPSDHNKGGFSMPNWIITDVRFENEVKTIKDRGGIIIRVNRPSVESNDSHPSETGLDSYKNFDYIIANDSSIENLIEKVKKILIKESIL
jgi:hypothetical protein